MFETTFIWTIAFLEAVILNATYKCYHSMLFNNSWIKEEMKEEIKQFIETNDNDVFII